MVENKGKNKGFPSFSFSSSPPFLLLLLLLLWVVVVVVAVEGCCFISTLGGGQKKFFFFFFLLKFDPSFPTKQPTNQPTNQLHYYKYLDIFSIHDKPNSMTRINKMNQKFFTNIDSPLFFFCLAHF